MSIRIASHVWDNCQQSGSSLLVMLALADWCNDDGTCWPSVEAIAQRARISKRQAQRILRQLAEAGEIVAEIGIGRHNASVYRLCRYVKDDTGDAKGDTGDAKGDVDVTFSEPKKVTPASPFPLEKVTSRAEKVTPVTRKGDIAMSPDPLDPSIDPSYVRTNARATAPAFDAIRQSEPPEQAETRWQYITAISAVVKDTLWERTQESFESAAEALIRDGVTIAQVDAFGPWWQQHSYYHDTGKASLTTFVQEIRNSIAGVKPRASPNGNGKRHVNPDVDERPERVGGVF